VRPQAESIHQFAHGTLIPSIPDLNSFSSLNSKLLHFTLKDLSAANVARYQFRTNIALQGEVSWIG
jgi:hypothetical protein